MWRMVLDDFRCGAGARLKRALKSCYMYLYSILYMPIFLHFESGYIICFFFFGIPMLSAILLSRMYGGKMNKTLYLCPMSEDDRRKYWLVLWGIRTGFPTGLSLLLNGALLAFRVLPAVMFLVVTVMTALHAAALNLYCPPMEGDGVSEKKHPLPGSYEVWDVFLQVISLVTIAFLAEILDDAAEAKRAGAEILVIPLLVGHAVLAVCMLGKYFRPVLEYIAQYEILPQSGQKNEDNRKNVA